MNNIGYFKAIVRGDLPTVEHISVIRNGIISNKQTDIVAKAVYFIESNRMVFKIDDLLTKEDLPDEVILNDSWKDKCMIRQNLYNIELTPLHIACYYGRVDIAKYFLGQVDIIVKFSPGDDKMAILNCNFTPLMMASLCKDPEAALILARMLMDAGAQINPSKTWEKLTALHLAARNNHHRLIRLYLYNGANVNDDSHGMSPLYLTLCNDQVDYECVDILLDAGAKIQHRDDKCCPLRTLVLKITDIKLLERFLRNPTFKNDHKYNSGISILDKKPNAMSHFMRRGMDVLDVLDMLFSHGIDIISGIKPEIMTPIFSAIESGRSDVLEKLISYGADVNSRYFGRTPVMSIFSDYKGDTPFNMNSNPIIGGTLSSNDSQSVENVSIDDDLDKFCQENGPQTAMFRMLLKNGADVNICDDRGRPVIHHALSSWHIELSCLKMIFDLNPSLDHWPLEKICACSPQGLQLKCMPLTRCPSEYAAWYIKYVKSIMPESPLFISCKNLNIGVARLLLHYGYDIRYDHWVMMKWTFPSGLILPENARFLKKLQTQYQNPYNLDAMCRIKIRRLLGTGIKKSIRELGLSLSIQDFLLYQ